MGVQYPILGAPGAITPRRATPLQIFEGRGIYLSAPGGVYIDGSLSRDWGNTGDLGNLRCGLLMGKITTGKKYAPTILGVTTGTSSANGTPYTSGGTSICVAPAAAVEIVRRIGSTGNLTYVGPPTANGTNAVLSTIAYSAVNQTSGVITTSTLGADLVVGGLVTSTDGSGLPKTFIGDGWPTRVLDADGASVSSVQWSTCSIAGTLLAANLINWPTDTSIQAWIISNLNGPAGGQFIFTDYVYH